MLSTRTKSVVRVFIVFVISVIIWRLMLLLIDMQDVSDNWYPRITAGILTSICAGILIVAMSRIENKRIELSVSNFFVFHLKYFVYGLICWIIPVAIGFYIFETLGYLSITTNAPTHILASQLSFLFVAVFFIEAFPEEIIRSYIFSNLEQFFSPWIAFSADRIVYTICLFNRLNVLN